MLLEFILFTPLFFLVNFAIFFLWIGLYIRYIVDEKRTSELLITYNSYTIYLILITIALYLNMPVNAASLFQGSFTYNIFDIAVGVFLLLAFIIITAVSVDASSKAIVWRFNSDVEVLVLKLLIVLSTLFLLFVSDLIYMFFILEIYALSTYILVAHKGRLSVFGSESAIKYFILGTIFSIVMIYSIAVLYVNFASTNFTLLEVQLALFPLSSIPTDVKTWVLLVTLPLLLVAFLFKLAAAPFHSWAPDTYDGTPLNIMFFLSVIPKIALLTLMIKLNYLWTSSASFSILMVAVTASFIVGSVGGILQKRVKRLLTYSMINNNGFFLVVLAFSALYSKVLFFFFLFTYIFTLIGTFTTITSIRLYSTEKTLKNIWVWTNLFFTHKLLAFTLILLLFSSAGLPPLIGFLSKFLILFGLSADGINLRFLVILILVVSSISCFYYIRVIKIISFNRRKVWLFLAPITFLRGYIISLFVSMLFLLFICSGFILNLITCFLL